MQIGLSLREKANSDILFYKLKGVLLLIQILYIILIFNNYFNFSLFTDA